MWVWFITKFFKIIVLLAISNYVSGSCRYANLLRDNDLANIYDDYMSPTSYDTYDTHCHYLVEQPPEISDTIIEHALNSSVDQTNRYISLDIDGVAGVPTPKFFNDMDRNNYFFESATKYVQQVTCSSKNTTTMHLSTIQLEKFHKYMTEDVTKVACEGGHIKFPRCLGKSSRRQVDGTCNNLKRPLDGRAGDCMIRLLPPDYRDGVSEFRTSIDGSPLPNARILSTNLFGDDDKRPWSSQFTQFQSFIGEFVISDNAMTLNLNSAANVKGMNSCDHGDRKRLNHPQCAGVPIPPNDFLRQIYPKQTCMPFARAIPCSRCRFGPRMMANSVTAAHDLNFVYGVSTAMSNARRTMVGGRLKSQVFNGHELFAVERFNETGQFRCFEGKCELSPQDSRNAMLPTGQYFALLFHRNHNRHARELEKVQPFWNDEQLFQEARRWNIAEYQHCLFNEFLSTWIGSDMASYFGILPKPFGQYSEYNPDVPLRTVIEFQTTAGRFGHASLTEDINMIDLKTGRQSKINFRQSELFESIFYKGHVDEVFLAQISKPTYEITPSIPFKTYLFNLPKRTFGIDLASLDIQRQRDHGIPGYIHYLKYCHGVEVHRWQDLLQFIDSAGIEKLRKFYKTVKDIELYVGGNYERKLANALVGPTFGHIIGIQFHNVKHGDRFFYEHGNQVGSFKNEQLNEIKKKTSFASILCKNTKLKKVTRDPLRLMSETNQFLSCSEFDDFDYKLDFVRKLDRPSFY